MKKYKILCVAFTIAALCFLAGTINHLINTQEGWISSMLLSGGCICFAIACYKVK